MNYDAQQISIFPIKPIIFKIKYMQVNAPDIYLENGLTDDKNDLWQNLKTRVSAIITECLLQMHNYMGLSVNRRLI